MASDVGANGLQADSEVALLFDYSEQHLIDLVTERPAQDLVERRTTALAELTRLGRMAFPALNWSTAILRCRRSPEGWFIAMAIEMDDPNYVTPYVHFGGEEVNSGAAPDCEQGMLTLWQISSTTTPKEALLRFVGTLHRYKQELERVSIEIERFNLAVPYLLSTWIEARLMDWPVRPATRGFGAIH